MALKIRLRKQGRTNAPCYRLVVTDAQNKRDGEYVEMVGWYQPQAKDEAKILDVKGERVQHWLDLGAQLTPKAKALVARAVPEVAQAMDKRLADRQTKLTAKRRARRRAAKAAA